VGVGGLSTGSGFESRSGTVKEEIRGGGGMRQIQKYMYLAPSKSPIVVVV